MSLDIIPMATELGCDPGKLHDLVMKRLRVRILTQHFFHTCITILYNSVTEMCI